MRKSTRRKLKVYVESRNPEVCRNYVAVISEPKDLHTPDIAGHRVCRLSDMAALCNYQEKYHIGDEASS